MCTICWWDGSDMARVQHRATAARPSKVAEGEGESEDENGVIVRRAELVGRLFDARRQAEYTLAGCTWTHITALCDSYKPWRAPWTFKAWPLRRETWSNTAGSLNRPHSQSRIQS